MENLVNKKVRFQNRLTKTTLVACSDKKSVNHIRLDDNNPKPDNSVWKIKSKHPDKSIRLESVYGKLLAWETGTDLIAMQVDKPPPHNKAAHHVHDWWTLEDVDESGFTGVRIITRNKKNHCVCLYPDTSNSHVAVGLKKELSWWISWLGERLYIWDLEILDDPIIDPPINDPGRVIGKSEDNPPAVTPPFVEGIPSASYTYKVDRMYVYHQEAGMAGTSFPFPNYANSGRNVNESGTQIVGGVKVQTHIDNLVNKKIVKRTS